MSRFRVGGYRAFVIKRCPECHGQVHEMTVAHFNDCPNRSRMFLAEEVAVPWPDDEREGGRP